MNAEQGTVSPGSSSESGSVAARGDGLFVRNATGLVRQVSPFVSTVINFTPGNPVQTLAAGLLFALSLFPGGNYFVALALITPLMLAFAYAYGLLTAAIPRTGGDYTLVGRILTPALGMIAAFSQIMAVVLTAVFAGIAFVETGIGPSLVSFGLLEHHPTFVRWGTEVTSEKGWLFGIAAGMILLVGLAMVQSWRRLAKIQTVLFAVCIGGLAISVLIAIFTTHSGFVNAFNKFALPYSHSGDTYNGVIASAAKAGVNPHPAFSWSATVPMLGVLATFAIFTYWSTYIGAEIRKGASLGTPNRMALAGFLNLASVLVCVLVVFHVFSREFLAAGYGGGMPSSLPVAPYYFLLSGVIVHSGWVALILGLSYSMFWPLLVSVGLLAPTRMLFAFAFDGVLPKAMTKVGRGQTPWAAVAVTIAIVILVLIWAVFVTHSFFQVIVYGTVIELVAMGLVGLAALVFPWRRPDVYRGSVSTRTLLRIPLVSIAGATALAGSALLVFIYFHYKGLGLAKPGQFLLVAGVTFVAAIVYWLVATFWQGRHGTDLRRVYREIPPE